MWKVKKAIKLDNARFEIKSQHFIWTPEKKKKRNHKGTINGTELKKVK